MSKPPSSILIYGICETPSILWDAHCLNPRRNNVNRQYICLNDESLTLRIGSKGWLEVKPEQLLQFQSNSDINSYTKEMLLSKVNAFNRPIKNAIKEATDHLKHSAGNFYINDKPTGAVVGQQPFGGSRASGTNDKAGSELNLQRWISVRTIKETYDTPKDYRYPFLGEQ